jgi:hypothetical protein
MATSVTKLEQQVQDLQVGMRQEELSYLSLVMNDEVWKMQLVRDPLHYHISGKLPAHARHFRLQQLVQATAHMQPPDSCKPLHRHAGGSHPATKVAAGAHHSSI